VRAHSITAGWLLASAMASRLYANVRGAVSLESIRLSALEQVIAKVIVVLRRHRLRR
jgi:hypothetical protein